MVTLHRRQALKLPLVVVSLPLGPRSGTKCAETTTKRVRIITLRNIVPS